MERMHFKLKLKLCNLHVPPIKSHFILRENENFEKFFIISSFESSERANDNDCYDHNRDNHYYHNNNCNNNGEVDAN